MLLSATVCAPASAQVRIAAAVAGSAVPRVVVSMPFTAPSFGSLSSPFASASLAPSAFASPVSAPALTMSPAASVAVPISAALPSAAHAVPLAAAVSAVPIGPVAAAALPSLSAASTIERGPSAVAEAASPSAQRSSWERFWSGSAARSADDGSTPVSAAPGRAAAAAALIAPVAHGASTVWAHAAPYAEAGAVVAGTFAANRVAHWALNKFAAGRDIDRHQMAAIRLVTSVLLWTGATVAALHVGGAPPELTTTVFGAGGTILTLGLRDILGNLIQGVNFLVTRPYTIGARIQVDDKVGTVSDLSLTGVVLRKDDGAELKIRHAALAAKPVIVFGAYQFPDASLHLGRISVPAKPKFDGVAGAVWSSLNRKFWISAAALAALLVVPHFVGFLAAGWAATVVQYALAGATAWTTQIIAAALGKAVDKLAERNGWRVETRVISRLVAQAAVWAVGGGAALRLVGVSWTMLGASVGLTTLGVGLASNNFFGTVVQGGEVLFAKPFKIGDRLKISTFDGVVEDMTLYHVVLKLDEGRHALIPYAVVRDALLDVSHPAPPTKEDKK